MERDIDRQLFEYKASDMNRRLDMYMQFPALRTRFLEIDRSEMGSKPWNDLHEGFFAKKESSNAVWGFGGRMIHFISTGLGAKSSAEKCREFC